MQYNIVTALAHNFLTLCRFSTRPTPLESSRRQLSNGFCLVENGYNAKKLWSKAITSFFWLASIHDPWPVLRPSLEYNGFCGIPITQVGKRPDRAHPSRATGPAVGSRNRSRSVLFTRILVSEVFVLPGIHMAFTDSIRSTTIFDSIRLIDSIHFRFDSYGIIQYNTV